ncbi:transient receptor potential cation channel subfamily M member 4 isoform X2 [Ambystoma mexicanum]|uniref:transient receptor potential cation channel subfamily M member 4 isoform X2 n=1 Tax=Ambystoma mexicanum TaxID=8296 RepID=UPI0037E826ED
MHRLPGKNHCAPRRKLSIPPHPRLDRPSEWIPRYIKKKTCTTFIEDSSMQSPLSYCQCGAPRNIHVSVAMEDNFGAAIVSKWESQEHTTEEQTDAFGDIEFAGAGKKVSKFARISNETEASIVYTLITQQWKYDPPNLVVSVVGGDGDFKIRTWLKDILRKGLVKAAQSTGAWIMTGGMQAGIGKYVGEAVRDHATANTNKSNDKVIAMGIAPWGIVHNRNVLVNPKGSFPAKYEMKNVDGPTCSLDNNYSAFLLVDDGTQHKLGGETDFRARLEEHISRQKTGIGGRGSIEIPVLCMLIAGESKMLERVYNVTKSTIPCLLVAGSGGVADCLAEILEDSISMDSIRGLVEEKLTLYFPGENLVKMVDWVEKIVANRELVTVYSDQDETEEFENVILKALVKACKKQTNDAIEYLDELKLAVAWNRVDIATNELFHGEIQWKPNDLVDTMTDALVNNKPSFVKLFMDNGLNIMDYLTYGQLEELYSSVTENDLLYNLLRKKQEERQESSKSQHHELLRLESMGKGPGFTLYEVSKVLRELLGDICTPFYTQALERHKPSLHRKSSNSKPQLDLSAKGKYEFQTSPTPWIDLFIWAILQNRDDMATFFWEMGPDAVSSALAATKILRELSRMEQEAEEAKAMRELAAKFEHLAIGVFNDCYSNHEGRSLKLLVRRSQVWMGATCLQLAYEADARNFFAQDGVQVMLTENWWGEMVPSTPVWKLMLTFFCPPLIYSSLIHFKSLPEEGKTETQQHLEMDSLDVDVKIPMLERDDTLENGEEKEPAQDLVDGVQATQIRPREGSRSNGRKRPWLLRRWKQFWSAPVTAFLGNVVMYFTFLLLFSYVLLLDFKPTPPLGPANSEIILYFWVFTMVCEEIRQSFFVGTMPVAQKVKQYLQDSWNHCDITALLLFILGVVCRMFESSYEDGRTILCLDFMIFTLRLIHIFTVNKQLGPKIIIVQKMMKDVFFFLFFLGVWLIAYGVATEGLLHPNDMRLSWIFRRVFYRPYLQIFGQIPQNEIDASQLPSLNCTDNPITILLEEAVPCTNTYANWLVILLLVIFLLVANILLLNLLIAMFSYTFSKVQGNSDIYWKFQRYNLIVEYHNRPAMAPPFIILSHIHTFIKRKIRKVESMKIKHFMLSLSEAQDSRMLTWETIQKENYLLNLAKLKRDSDTERLRRTSQKVDNALKQLTEIKEHDRRLKALEHQLEYCTSALSWMVEAMSQSEMGKDSPAPPLMRDRKKL